MKPREKNYILYCILITTYYQYLHLFIHLHVYRKLLRHLQLHDTWFFLHIYMFLTILIIYMLRSLLKKKKKKT